MNQKADYSIAVYWENWLLAHKCSWIPTVSLFPILYLLGWLAVQPLLIIFPNLQEHDLSLVGTILTFLFFLALLPNWIRSRWRTNNILLVLGLSGLASKSAFRSYFIAFIWAVTLVCCVLIPILLGQWFKWGISLSIFNLINGICLGFGVGFAEELIFRGWLWGEANVLIGPKSGIFVQAIIFSLVHVFALLNSSEWTFTTSSVFEFVALLIGLFLLGLVLATRRIIDKGSLSGCIALHGGLVGIWFIVNTNLIAIAQDTPIWMIGPGSPAPNPIGSLIGISCLILILFFYRNAFAIAGRPVSGERKDSFKGATP